VSIIPDNPGHIPAPTPTTDDAPDLWGAMRGSVMIPVETDLTVGTGDIWAAEA
jgi:hypothetical protein